MQSLFLSVTVRPQLSVPEKLINKKCLEYVYFSVFQLSIHFSYPKGSGLKSL